MAKPCKAHGPACSIEGCGASVYAHDYCGMHYQRWRKHRDPHFVRALSGSENPNWRDDDIGYAAAHLRIRNSRGPAKTYRCRCGNQAVQWAYNYLDPDPAEKFQAKTYRTGSVTLMPYSADPNRYIAMCRQCHRTFDLERKSYELRVLDGVE